MNRTIELIYETYNHVTNSLTTSPYPFVYPKIDNNNTDHLLTSKLDTTHLH
jgi:hypothetical protein